MDLTLTRRGSFRVEAAEHDATQCGKHGTRKFYFRAELTCPDSALDASGFLVDQFEVLGMFRRRYRRLHDFVSCERLALDACNALRELCPSAHRIRVSIGANKFAYMTAELHAAPSFAPNDNYTHYAPEDFALEAVR